MGVAVGIALLSSLQAKILVFPVLEAAILDFLLPVMSYNLLSSSIGWVDFKYIDLAFEISFLCCPQAEIYVFKLKCRFGVRHLEFLLPVTSYSIPDVLFG